jgi:hypothetical protein
MGLKKARRLGNNNLVASGLSGGADGASGDAAPPIRSIPVADVQKTLQQLEVLNKGLNEKLHRALGKLNVKSADLNLSFKTFPYLLEYIYAYRVASFFTPKLIIFLVVPRYERFLSFLRTVT